MPYSRAQKIAVRIAEHDPDKLYDRNKGLLSMTPGQKHDFGSGSDKGLPYHSSDANSKNVYAGLGGKKKKKGYASD